MEKIEEDLKYSTKINNIDFSSITTHYYYSLAAGIMSLGFKYCGSNDKSIAKIIIDIIKDKLLKVKLVKEIIISSSVKYTNENKFSLVKKKLFEILCICVYSLSLIMSGSGDLDTFKTMKIIRKKVTDLSDVKYCCGYTLAVDHAIGMLFLGNGCVSLNSSLSSFPFLYISTFPQFNQHLNDNTSYLQPLRYLFVCSCENKIFELRDDDTNEIVKKEVLVEYLNGEKMTLVAPGNLSKSELIKKISVRGEVESAWGSNVENRRYFDLEISGNDSKDEGKKKNLMRPKISYLKRHNYLPEIILTYIIQIDTNNTENALNFINLALNSLKNTDIPQNIAYFYTENYDSLITKQQNIRKFDLIFIKFIFLLFYTYVNSENFGAFLIIYEKLKLVYNFFERENWAVFGVFDELELLIKHPSLILINSSPHLTIVYEELTNSIKNSLTASFKNRIETFIKIYNSSNIEDSIIDWNLINYLKLCGVSLAEFESLIKFIQIMKSNGSQDIMNDLLLKSSLGEIINDFNYDFIKNLCKYYDNN